MNLGTKTLLFGVHQIFIHPILVTVAWVKLYRSFPTWREMVCILIHDWGYWGRPNLKDADGDKHPELGAKLAHWLFDRPRIVPYKKDKRWVDYNNTWRDFILGHSSFYVVRHGVKQSKLFAPDKYWHCMIPLWVYKALSVSTGEFRHYRELKHARQVAEPHESDAEWWAKLQRACYEKIAGTFEIDRRKLAN